MTRRTYVEKRAWVLARLAKKWAKECKISTPPMRPFICGVDEEDQEAWQSEFGGREVTYVLGPNVSPDFARTLRRMWIEGDLMRSVVGVSDRPSPNWKSYYTSYTIKDVSMFS